MRIVLNHVCPNCRIQRDGWNVKGTKVKGQAMAGRRREREPLDAEALAILGKAETHDLVDQCEACGQRMAATLEVEIKGGGIPRIIGVTER